MLSPWGGGKVSLAFQGGFGDAQGASWVAKVDCLVGHGPQDVPDQRGIVGFAGEFGCDLEVAQGWAVFGVVEPGPAAEVGQLRGAENIARRTWSLVKGPLSRSATVVVR
ncbi:hypothetical protein ACFQ9X_31460 [Catenulispora yoronensis]